MSSVASTTTTPSYRETLALAKAFVLKDVLQPAVDNFIKTTIASAESAEDRTVRHLQAPHIESAFTADFIQTSVLSRLMDGYEKSDAKLPGANAQEVLQHIIAGAEGISVSSDFSTQTGRGKEGFSQAKMTISLDRSETAGTDTQNAPKLMAAKLSLLAGTPLGYQPGKSSEEEAWRGELIWGSSSASWKY